MKFLLDPGHGGLAFGHYLTPGKRSPEIPPGIYEGAFNRRICRIVEFRAQEYKQLDALSIAPGPANIPLKARVSFVNQLYRREKNLALISVHCNAAAARGWSTANGFTIFISRRASDKSKELAQILHERYADIVPIRSRGIKQKNFTMIHKTKCPAVLLEMGFMINRREVIKLQLQATQEKIVSAILAAMSEYTDYVL